MQDSYSCRIQNHILRKDKVYYYILIINNRTGNIRQLKLRYSECKKLHEKIQKIVGKFKLQVYLPVFPGRKLFGTTNKDENNILQRRIELNYYYNELLSIQKLHSLEQFQELVLPPVVENQQEQTLDQSEQGEANNTFMNLTGFEDDMDDFEMRAPTEGGNIRVKIDRYQVAEDVVNYFITFFDMTLKQDWTFKSRYSEIRGLNEALQKQKIKASLPQFPKRKLFGITNENPEEIEKRREQLENFLNQLYSNNEVVNNDVGKFFLQDGKRQSDIIKQKEQNSQRKRRMRMLKHKQEEIIQQVITKQGDTKQLMQQGQHLQEKQQELLDNIQQDLKGQKRKKKKFKIQHLDRVQEVHSRYECDEYFQDQQQKQNQLKLQQKKQQQKLNNPQNSDTESDDDQVEEKKNESPQKQKKQQYQTIQNVNQINDKTQQIQQIQEKNSEEYKNNIDEIENIQKQDQIIKDQQQQNFNNVENQIQSNQENKEYLQNQQQQNNIQNDTQIEQIINQQQVNDQ